MLKGKKERQTGEEVGRQLCVEGKKTMQTGEEVGRQHQIMYRPGVRKIPEGSEER